MAKSDEMTMLAQAIDYHEDGINTSDNGRPSMKSMKISSQMLARIGSG